MTSLIKYSYRVVPVGEGFTVERLADRTGIYYLCTEVDAEIAKLEKLMESMGAQFANRQLWTMAAAQEAKEEMLRIRNMHPFIFAYHYYKARILRLFK
jgi:hypothetical protein